MFALCSFRFFSRSLLQMVLPNLTTNTYYEVKVRAASISTINPRQVILGSYSEPQKVSVACIKPNHLQSNPQRFSLLSYAIFHLPHPHLVSASHPQILLQLNCEKIQPLQQKNPGNYNLTMLAGALFSCFGIILILLAFVLWR